MDDKEKLISDLYELSVNNIMKTSVPYVEKNADITNILPILNKKEHAWVVDSKETLHLLGVITESDTLLLFSPALATSQYFDKPILQSLQYGLSTTAEEIMSKNPVKVNSEEKIKNTIIMMKQNKIKQIAVVDENNILLGEVSIHQIIDKYIKIKSKKLKK